MIRVEFADGTDVEALGLLVSRGRWRLTVRTPDGTRRVRWAQVRNIYSYPVGI